MKPFHDVQNVFAVVSSRKIIFRWPVLLLLLASAFSFVSTATAEQAKYTASAFLRVSMFEMSIIGGKTVGMNRDWFEIYKNTQKQFLLSRFVLLAALRKPEAAKLLSVQQEAAAGDVVRWLAERLHVTFPDDAEIMKVSLTSDDPKEAAALVNAAVDAYLTEVVNAERDRKRQHFAELDRAYVEKETESRAKRENLRKLLDQQVLGNSEIKVIDHTAAVEELTRCQKEMADLRAEGRLQKRKLIEMKAGIGIGGPDAQDMIRIMVSDCEVRIAVNAEQQKELEKEIQQARNEVEKFSSPSMTSEIVMMQNEIKNIETVLAEIVTEREKVRIEIRAAPRVTLLQKADVPEAPDE